MERPTPDLLHDYLEGLELLEALRQKRRTYEALSAEEAWQNSGNPETLEKGGGQEPQMERFVEEQIRRVEALLTEYERGMESVLHSLADREDAGRALFDSVSASIEEVRGWSAQDWAQWPSELAEEWNRLLRDFETLQRAWKGRLPRRQRDG